MDIILYSNKLSPRLSYVIDFFSRQISDDIIIITSDKTTYISADAVKINYSSASVTVNEFRIEPHGLLFQKDIQQQNIDCFHWTDLKAFFKTNGDIPFDIFAASFYLLSRYEEYLPNKKDMYGRYAHENSLAYEEEFLHLPVINLWIKEFAKLLKQKFPFFTIHHSPFTFLPTYDIDIAYAYKCKSTATKVGGAIREVFSFKWNDLMERLKVMSGSDADPFDTYAWLEVLHRKHGLQPCYFFLLAEQRRGYDKNISPHTQGMQQLIKAVARNYDTGIHPSWQSGDDVNLLRKEIALLQSIIMKPVTKSRQHYIRMTLPDTYRLLIESGIREDHSMGYGSINGFRASVATFFYWYDLSKEEQTSLCIRPFCYMEANSFFEQHYTAEQAAEELQQFHDVVKSVNGELITIFHNHFITEQKQWSPWRNMYAAFIAENFDCGC